MGLFYLYHKFKPKKTIIVIIGVCNLLISLFTHVKTAVKKTDILKLTKKVAWPLKWSSIF